MMHTCNTSCSYRLWMWCFNWKNVVRNSLCLLFPAPLYSSYSLLLRRTVQAAERYHHLCKRSSAEAICCLHLHRKRATAHHRVWAASRGQGAAFHGAANAANGAADSPVSEEKGFTQLRCDPGVIECYQRLPEATAGPTLWRERC